MDKIGRRIVEGLIVLTFVPVWILLAVLNWLGHKVFGEYDDYER